MKLVTGNSNRALAEAVASYLELPLTDCTVKRFADKEIFVEIHENVRGEDVFILQSTSFPVNDNLMELLILTDALRRSSARRITAVMPYFGYARQDRKSASRTPISAKLVANLITEAGVNRVITLDLHAAQIQGFFDIPTDNLYGAIAGDSSGYYDALASAQIGLDMFKLAASVETTHDASGGTALDTNAETGATQAYYNGGDGAQGLGFGLSGSLQVSDSVSLNLGGRYFDTDTNTADNEGYQVAASLVAAVTETLSLQGEIGVYGQNSGGAGATSHGANTYAAGVKMASGPTFPTGTNTPGTWENTYYGAASATWAPGGGFTSSLKGEVFSDNAYRLTFNAAKNFQ